MKLFKTEKFWLKGGLIALFIIAVVDIVSLIIAFGVVSLLEGTFIYKAWSLSSLTEVLYGGVVLIPYIISYFILVIFFKAPFDGSHPTEIESFMWNTSAILLTIIIIFGVGAIFGSIFGKIKLKKSGRE